MDPITIAAAGSIASGILQYMNSQDAAEASAADLAEMRKLLAKVQDPQFDIRQLNPADYMRVQNFVPEVAPIIEEANPQLVKQTQQAAEQRGIQQQVLAKYLAQSRGEDPELAASLNRAQREALATGNSQRASIEQNMAQRGMGSGLMSAALANQASGRAAMNAGVAGEQAAMDMGQRQNAALANAAGISSNIYGQEMSQQERNAQIMNAFNERMAGMRQQQMNKQADTRNQYRWNDMQNQQDMAKYNQGNYNQQAQQGFQNQMSKLGQQQQQTNAGIQQRQQNTAQQNQAIQGVAQGVGAYAQYQAGADDREADKKYKQSMNKYYGG